MVARWLVNTAAIHFSLKTKKMKQCYQSTRVLGERVARLKRQSLLTRLFGNKLKQNTGRTCSPFIHCTIRVKTTLEQIVVDHSTGSCGQCQSYAK